MRHHTPTALPAHRASTGLMPTATTMLLAGLAAAWLAAAPHAQAQTKAYKVASDLQLALDAKQAPAQPWVREVNGQRVLRVLITAQTPGSDLAAAREDIAKRGGTVLSHSPTTSTVVAVLPAAQVRPVAERPDVMHVAPDRQISVAGVTPGQGAQSLSLPGFAPSMATARGRSDLALLGE